MKAMHDIRTGTRLVRRGAVGLMAMGALFALFLVGLALRALWRAA